VKIGVFGNCQAQGFADSIVALAGHQARVYTVQEARNAPTEELEQWAQTFADMDIVFTQPSITAGFGPLSMPSLLENCKTVVPYPHLAFTGQQPDCHYIRKDGIALSGPIGPYHSAIVAASYLERIPVDRVIRLFNKFVYSSLGYLGIDEAFEPLCRDSKLYGYDFTDFLQGKRGIFMHTINHPNIEIIFESARQALTIAGVNYAGDAERPKDHLENIAVWPAYPGVLKSLPGSTTFSYRRKKLELIDFIEASYRAYEGATIPLNSIKIDTARAFLQRCVN
jgi:hypothetical protein